MSSDWHKKRRSSEDTVRQLLAGRVILHPMRKKGRHLIARTPAPMTRRAAAAFHATSALMPRGPVSAGRKAVKHLIARTSAPMMRRAAAAFHATSAWTSRPGFRREEGSQAPHRPHVGADDGPRRDGFPRDQRPDAPRPGFRRDDGERESERGWQPFSSPFGHERNTRDDRKSAPFDRSAELPDWFERNEGGQADERSARQRPQGYDRPWQHDRKDAPPFDRDARGQERAGDRERSFPARDAEADWPFRRRDDEGYAARSPRGFSGD